MSLLCLSGTAKAQSLEVRIDGAVGKLQAVIQKPELKSGEKCPMVILMHGFMDRKESAVISQIANELQAHGIASIRFDFNGHGQSEGDFQKMTVPNEIEDAHKVFDYVSQLPYVDADKIGVAGHSQGGVVAAMLAGELKNRVADVLLLAPAAVLRDDAIRGSTMGKTYDPQNPPEYVEMFNGRKLGRDYINTAFNLPIYETAAGYQGKSCVLHGTGDRLVPYTYGERFALQWPGCELHILSNEDHGFTANMSEAVKLGASHLIKSLK